MVVSIQTKWTFCIISINRTGTIIRFTRAVQACYSFACLRTSLQQQVHSYHMVHSPSQRLQAECFVDKSSLKFCVTNFTVSYIPQETSAFLIPLRSAARVLAHSVQALSITVIFVAALARHFTDMLTSKESRSLRFQVQNQFLTTVPSTGWSLYYSTRALYKTSMDFATIVSHLTSQSGW